MVKCIVSGKVKSVFPTSEKQNVSVLNGDKHYDTVFGVPLDLKVKEGDEVSYLVRIRRYYKSEKNYGYFFVFVSSNV